MGDCSLDLISSMLVAYIKATTTVNIFFLEHSISCNSLTVLVNMYNYWNIKSRILESAVLILKTEKIYQAINLWCIIFLCSVLKSELFNIVLYF